MEDYFTAASIIDISNHCRQSGLALETAWNTLELVGKID